MIQFVLSPTGGQECIAPCCCCCCIALRCQTPRRPGYLNLSSLPKPRVTRSLLHTKYEAIINTDDSYCPTTSRRASVELPAWPAGYAGTLLDTSILHWWQPDCSIISLIFDHLFIYLFVFLSSHGSLRQTQDPMPRPGRDHVPICNLPTLWPVGLVALMQGQAELPRAQVRRLTGAWLGPAGPARLQQQRSSPSVGDKKPLACSWPDVSAL